MDKPHGSTAEFFRIGLRDPYVKGIGALVFIASAVSIAIALALIFGVVLVVFRVLLKNVENTIVIWSCIVSSAVLTGVFLIFVILSIPAVTFCWPPPYAQFLGIASCSQV